MSSRWVSRIVVLAITLFALSAAAAPAKVKVFEAQAHATASTASRVVHVFPEGADVSVSEQSDGGWRRVRLPDGGTAFIRDEELAVSGAQATQAAPAAPPAAAPEAAPLPTAGDKQVAIYVKDLNHFAELVKSDPLVGPRADDLVRKRKIGLTGMAIGLTAGVVIAVAATTFLAGENCTSYSSGSSRGGSVSCLSSPRWGLASLGFGIAAAGAIFPWFYSPSRNDLLDIINIWNQRHPDEQFDIVHEPARSK